MVKQARVIMTTLLTQKAQAAQRLLASAQQIVPLIERVIHQAHSRVIEGKQVAASDKVLSLYEPHTRAIPRHKGGALVEFGRQVVFDEVEGGIITRYEILEHPNEHGQAPHAVSHHRRVFGRPPRLFAGDRGLYSSTTEEQLKAAGVKTVAIPASDPLTPARRAYEQSRAFKRAYRWRAGIEGRLHSLRRDYGLRQCDYHGEEGMQRWIGLGVLASNLRQIAKASAGSSSATSAKA